MNRDLYVIGKMSMNAGVTRWNLDVMYKFAIYCFLSALRDRTPESIKELYKKKLAYDWWDSLVKVCDDFIEINPYSQEVGHVCGSLAYALIDDFGVDSDISAEKVDIKFLKDTIKKFMNLATEVGSKETYCDTIYWEIMHNQRDESLYGPATKSIEAMERMYEHEKEMRKMLAYLDEENRKWKNTMYADTPGEMAWYVGYMCGKLERFKEELAGDIERWGEVISRGKEDMPIVADIQPKIYKW